MDTIFKNIFTENLGKYMIQHKDNLNAIKRENEMYLSQDGFMTTTKNINKRTFRLLKTFGLDQSEFKKLPIMNIMPQQMCHYNCLFMKDNLPDVKVILGFNLTACDCGCFFTFELHSVIQYKNELYDITKDFNNEKHKYFIPLDIEINNVQDISDMRNHLMPRYGFMDGFIYIKQEHRCFTKNKYRYRIPAGHCMRFDEQKNKESIVQFFMNN